LAKGDQRETLRNRTKRDQREKNSARFGRNWYKPGGLTSSVAVNSTGLKKEKKLQKKSNKNLCATTQFFIFFRTNCVAAQQEKHKY